MIRSRYITEDITEAAILASVLHHDEVRLSPSQLIVIAAQFQERANEATNEGLRQEFVKTSEQLLETGLGRLQSATAQAAG